MASPLLQDKLSLVVPSPLARVSKHRRTSQRVRSYEAAGMDSLQHTQHDAEDAATLLRLPATVMCIILRMLPNPGAVMRSLCMSSKSLHQVITILCDAYWDEQCISTGWSEARAQHLRFDALPADEGDKWFHYYRHRLELRKRIRRLQNLYIPFLSRASQMAFMPGASITELKAAEDRLHTPLPWELWELYRHHAGQAIAKGVMWAPPDARLLGLHELVVEQVAIAQPFVHELHVEDAQQHLQQLDLPTQVAGSQLAAATSQSPAAGLQLIPAIRFASAANDTRHYLVDLQAGSVLLTRGLSTFVTAPSLIRFLQKLLT